MGHTSKNVDNTKCNWNCGSLTQDFSEKNFSLLPRDHSYILVKNVVAFHTFLKSLSEVKVKSFRFIVLTKEISKQLNINFFLRFTYWKHFDQAYQT